MITIGVDAHKRVHVAVAVDGLGRELGQWKGLNNLDGWKDLEEWATELGSSRQWGIEGAWNYGRGLAQHLVNAGETVYEVNPALKALGRRRARKHDKNDQLDARAVALALLREDVDLPRVTVEDETAVLELLTLERENALAEVTRLRNQIHHLLLQSDPEYKTHLPNLQTKKGLRALKSYSAETKNVLQQHRVEAVHRLAQRLSLALEQAEELARKIRALAQERFSALTNLCGIDLLTAGTLAGIIGPGRRFKTDVQLAAYAGVAPLEASSAERVRHRLNPGGNRRLNAILYRIALTQARHSKEARAYLDRRIGEGKTRREAFRALKRYIIRAIWRLWQGCHIIKETAIVEIAA